MPAARLTQAQIAMAAFRWHSGAIRRSASRRAQMKIVLGMLALVLLWRGLFDMPFDCSKAARTWVEVMNLSCIVCNCILHEHLSDSEREPVTA